MKFETLQSCPIFFHGTVSASWKAKQRMDYLLFFLLYCSQLFYLVFHLSFHLSHKKVILFIQTGRCSDFFLAFWLISTPSLFFLFKSSPGFLACQWMSEVLNPENCICHFVISPNHHWECSHTACIQWRRQLQLVPYETVRVCYRHCALVHVGTTQLNTIWRHEKSQGELDLV